MRLLCTTHEHWYRVGSARAPRLKSSRDESGRFASRALRQSGGPATAPSPTLSSDRHRAAVQEGASHGEQPVQRPACEGRCLSIEDLAASIARRGLILSLSVFPVIDVEGNETDYIRGARGRPPLSGAGAVGQAKAPRQGRAASLRRVPSGPKRSRSPRIASARRSILSISSAPSWICATRA